MPTAHACTAATAGATASTILEANGARKVLTIQPLDGDVWIRTDGQAATAAAPSLKIVSGRDYSPPESQVPSASISIIRAGSSNVSVTVVEG